MVYSLYGKKLRMRIALYDSSYNNFVLNIIWCSKPCIYSIIEIRINERVIQRFQYDVMKFLGVYFDENLKFDHHIDHISSKMSRSLGVLNKVRYYIPDYIRMYLYNSLIVPYLMYAVEVWGGSSACYTNRALKIQKAALRSIRNLPFNAHTSEHFKQFGLLKLPEIFKNRILLLIYSWLNFDTNPDLFTDLLQNSALHSHSTRYCNNLVIPRFHLSKTQMSVLFVGAKLWNALPDAIKSEKTSMSLFKQKLRQHLVSLY